MLILNTPGFVRSAMFSALAGITLDTPTVVSRAQIDLSWTDNSATAYGYLIEQSTDDITYYFVGNVPNGVTEYQIPGLDPATLYYHKLTPLHPTGNLSAIQFSNATTSTMTGTNYYVATTGSDTNDGLTVGNPFLTVQKAADTVAAGATVNIAAGTYNEVGDGSTSSGFTVAVALITAGTLANPIIFKASGADFSAIIDGQDTYFGLDTNENSFNIFQGLTIQNVKRHAIFSEGGAWLDVADGVWTEGIKVLNCELANVDAEAATLNEAAIRLDTSKNLHVRNCKIHDVTVNGSPSNVHASGIQAYRTWNALIEHNEIYNTSAAVLWKDHVLDSGAIIPGSIVRFNNFYDNYETYAMLPPGTGTSAGGDQDVYNNIFRGYYTGILCEIFNTDTQSSGMRLSNNMFDGTGNASARAISNDGMAAQETLGNIYYNNNKDSRVIWRSGVTDSWAGSITEAAYNIYTTTPQIDMDVFGTESAAFTSVSAWRDADTTNPALETLDTTEQGTGSIEDAIGDVVTNAATNDYTLTGTSSALALLADGSNAGPYQYGNTTVVGRF